MASDIGFPFMFEIQSFFLKLSKKSKSSGKTHKADNRAAGMQVRTCREGGMWVSEAGILGFPTLAVP